MKGPSNDGQTAGRRIYKVESKRVYTVPRKSAEELNTEKII